MAAELMSFGLLSKWFANLKEDSLQKSIAREAGLSAPVLRSFLRLFSVLRNGAAHHSRLWNRHTALRGVPELCSVHRRLRCSAGRSWQCCDLRTPRALARRKGRVACGNGLSSRILRRPPVAALAKDWCGQNQHPRTQRCTLAGSVPAHYARRHDVATEIQVTQSLRRHGRVHSGVLGCRLFHALVREPGRRIHPSGQ